MDQAPARHFRWVSVLLSLAFVGLGYVAFDHRQDVIDYYRLFTYKPSSEIVALADTATMQGRGRDLFFASEPKVSEANQFNADCTNNDEHSVVLGCYKLQQIFIFNVTDARLSGVKEVTAAHEMLHAAYERLGDGDRQKVNKLIEAQLATMNDPNLNELIALYEKSEPGERLNEMHSILGTEYSGLSAELENYYKQYFSDRSKLVALTNSYQALFRESEKRIATYDQELASLKQAVDDSANQLDLLYSYLSSQNAQLNTLRSSDPEAYNASVPAYNAKVREYNSLVSKNRTLVAQYNELVDKRNKEAAAQNSLYNSLDSKYQPVSSD